MNNGQRVILITGGTGFAGSHLVEALLKKGYSNIHVTSFGGSAGMVGSLLQPELVHQLDLSDQEKTLALIEQLHPDHIYHLAALASVGNSFDNAKQTIINNVDLQLNLLEAVRKFTPTARVLIVGSAMEYDLHATQAAAGQPIDEHQPLGPVSPYAVSKVAQDLLGLAYFYSYQIPVVRVRPFNHIGERQSPDFAVARFAQQIAAIEQGKQTELKVGNLEAIRDFTDVKDMVKAYILLMEQGIAGEVYNVGSGEGFLMKDILDQMIKLSSAQIKVVTDQSQFRPLDIPYTVTDNRKIRTLGWKPEIPLNLSLERILNYWRQQS